MDASRKQYIVTRLMTGVRFVKVQEKYYELINPTAKHVMLGEELRLRTIYDNRFETFLTRKEANIQLAKKGIWKRDDNESLKKLETQVEDFKVSLFQSQFNSSEQKKIRKRLSFAKRAITKAIEKKFFLEPMTIEYHAELLKKQYITAMCILDPDGNHCYDEKTFWTNPSFVLDNVLRRLSRDVIEIEELREVSRTEPFRSYWNLSGVELFGIPACDFSEDRKIVCSFAKMYDNAYKNPECPPDSVIEDDDMFDGWMINQRRERERDQNKSQTDKMIGNSDAGEVFIFAPTKEDANKVYNLNDQSAKIIMEKKKKEVQEKGAVMDEDLEASKMIMRQQLREGKK